MNSRMVLTIVCSSYSMKEVNTYSQGKLKYTTLEVHIT